MKINNLVQGQADEDIVWLSLDEALPKLFHQEAEFLETNRRLIKFTPDG